MQVGRMSEQKDGRSAENASFLKQFMEHSLPEMSNERGVENLFGNNSLKDALKSMFGLGGLREMKQGFFSYLILCNHYKWGTPIRRNFTKRI